MKIDIDMGSVFKTQAHLNKKSGNIKGAIASLLKKSIFVIEKHSKYYSPVDTGRMRSSIGGVSFDGMFSTGEQGLVFGDKFASIQPTVTYAKYVHRRVPFMRAGAQDSMQEIKQIAQEEINKAIK